ncbi:MAG: protein-L-isoaspartate(D-aspartate) O-methyltransferase [Candidatus Omnitrophica bacterium]|nr:protein-L-isoaspartate(D-aspartate) O-methyltransferase [Candidatus Omnitrophota bacterium]
MVLVEDNKYWREQRQRMVNEQLIPRGINNQRVLSAFLKVQRQRFVPFEFVDFAYADRPLPIGKGQTISQPYIVALMTQCLELKEENRVLEIGTGSGYQSAILAELDCSVYSIERYASLAEQADDILRALGYSAKIKIDDGTKGWEEFSPYEKIIVTSAAPFIPSSLFKQLKENGIMIIPLGNRFIQTLTLIKKIKGEAKSENICGCRFVPLVGEEGWEEESY